jgi:hypothetical protein
MAPAQTPSVLGDFDHRQGDACTALLSHPLNDGGDHHIADASSRANGGRRLRPRRRSTPLTRDEKLLGLF